MSTWSNLAFPSQSLKHSLIDKIFFFSFSASHVVPVMNYKSIGTNVLSTQCKFYPKCSNTSCQFYHPKPCHFGKNCANKLECNFYHFDAPLNPVNNKLKWVASASDAYWLLWRFFWSFVNEELRWLVQNCFGLHHQFSQFVWN